MPKIVLLVGAAYSGRKTVAEYVSKTWGYKVLYPNVTGSEVVKDGKHTYFSESEYGKIPKEEIVMNSAKKDRRYFITAHQVEEADLYVIGYSSLEYFKTHYHGNKSIIVVHMDATAGKRLDRMLKNGEDFRRSVNTLIHDQSNFEKTEINADVTINANQGIKESAKIVLGVLNR